MSKNPQSSVRNEFNRLEAASLPWWSQALPVLVACVSFAVMPLKLAVLAAEAVVAFAFAGLAAAVAAWWLGYIPDATVAQQMGILGERLLRIVESSGLI